MASNPLITPLTAMLPLPAIDVEAPQATADYSVVAVMPTEPSAWQPAAVPR